MKKIINIFIVVVLLSFGTSAFAQGIRATSTASSTPSRPGQTIREFLTSRAEHKWSKMVERFDRATTKEEAIFTRISKLIEKIKNNFGQTAEAETFLVEARTHLNLAKTSLDSLKALVAIAIAEEEAGGTIAGLKDNLVAMRKAAKETQTHLIAAHKALQKTVGSLRGRSQLNATTTNSRATSTNSN